MPIAHRPRRPTVLSVAGLVALAFAACVTVHAAAQPGEIPTIPFAHEPAFYGSDTVQSIVLAPDKPALYALSHAATVNLWPNLVGRWPEFLGGVAGLTTILLLLVVMRLRRREQRRGAPCCRRCNYDLTHQLRTVAESKGLPFAWDAGTRCPECGVSLDRTRPVRGRRLWRRAAPAFFFWLAVVFPYVAMLALRVPRHGQADRWLDLSSAWAAEHAGSVWIRWLAPKVDRTDRVVELALDTGTLTRVVTTRSSRTHFELTATPDGAALFLNGARNDRFDAVSTRTGRVLRSALLPGWPTVDVSRPAVIGFSPDGDHAYAQWWNRDRNLSGVASWAWRTTGEVTTLVEVEGYTDNRDGRASHWPRYFLLRDHKGENGSPRFLSLPSFMEAYPTQSFTVRLHDGRSDPRTIDVLPVPGPMQYPAVSPDGSTLFLAGQDRLTLQGVDLDTGESLGLLTAPMHSLNETIALSAGGRYLVVGSGSGLLVRDTAEKQWVAHLTMPASLYAPRPAISLDGRWIAAACQGGNPSSGIIHRIVIWDLGANRLDETAGDGTPAGDDAPPGR